MRGFDWNNVGSGPLLNLYIFDLAFKHNVQRKEVYTATVKNGKDIIAQKEEGRVREDRERKKTLSEMSFVWTGQVYCFLTAVWLGGVRAGPSFPSRREEIRQGWHHSSPPTIPASHTHTLHTHTYIRTRAKLTFSYIFNWILICLAFSSAILKCAMLQTFLNEHFLSI